MRLLSVLLAAMAFIACSPQQVIGTPPWTTTNLSGSGSIDKIDILFAIDSSPSMGDAQSVLAASVPAFIDRLLNPRCVSTIACTSAPDCAALGANAQCNLGNASGLCFVPGDGNKCTTVPNTKPEFDAVHDMHIGIVSSSLGGGGSPDICVAANPDATHQDDHGYLLNRTSGPPEGTVNNAKPLDGNGGNFLAWLPASDPRNAGKGAPNVTEYGDGEANQLGKDFQSLVQGVNQHGCGLEAQLESWYRFLIQPDPWDTITLTTDDPPKAVVGSNGGTGVDATLLKMRHDFLRPDSLVAIIQLTNKEDSWSDPMWLGGYGWTSRTQTFPGGPGQGAGPIGTSECFEPVDMNSPLTTGPNNPDCTSCAFPGSLKPIAKTPIGQDVNCQACAMGASSCLQKGWYTPAAPTVPITAADGLNARYASQLMRAKYGFDNQPSIQRYVDGLKSPTVPDRNNESHDSSNYVPTRNCTNPLFAQNLPDGSDTSPGAICTLQPGSRTPDLVFYTLIGGVPPAIVTDANGNLKQALTAADWATLVGKDPAHYIFDGIDPHMLQSTAPRSGLQTPPGVYTLGADPVNGREWNTLTSGAGIDLQYACTFTLPTPKDCTAAINAGTCDCVGAAAASPDGPPLCDPVTRSMQVRGKAYPAIRELRVAQALGTQAVVGSVCAPDDRVSLDGLVDRLTSTLAHQCLPSPLPRNPDGTSACSMIAVFPGQTQAKGCIDAGMSQPTADMLTWLQQDKASPINGGLGPPPAACVFTQLTSCTGSAPGWCYAVPGPQGCTQSILFDQAPIAPLFLMCPVTL